MKIGIATDHHGVIVKRRLIHYLEKQGYTIVNYGTDTKQAVDYPIYAFKVGEAVATGEIDFGILLCGSGIGMSIACNKVKGVRCAKVSTIKEARLSRYHNGANVIAMSSSISYVKMKKMVEVFLNTNLSKEERHYKRVELINHYGEQYDR